MSPEAQSFTLRVAACSWVPRKAYKSEWDAQDKAAYERMWNGLKRGEPAAADNLIALCKDSELPFQHSSLVVPIPRSREGTVQDKDPSYVLARALHSARYVGGGLRLLKRKSSLQKNSGQQRTKEQRTAVQDHIDTLSLCEELPAKPIVLVDDAVVTGTQLAGALVVLRQAGFTYEVSGFVGAFTPFDENSSRTHRLFDVRWTSPRRHPELVPVHRQKPDTTPV